VTVRLCLPDPLDDRIPVLSPVDLESGLGQLELIILPPLAPILRLVLLFVAEFFSLILDLRLASVPHVVSEQQGGDWMWGSCGFERVLRRVVDQDLCVDFLADLAMTLLGSIIPYSLRVRTSALFNLVISSCPFANVVS
jgi:hypothetical protein